MRTKMTFKAAALPVLLTLGALSCSGGSSPSAPSAVSAGSGVSASGGSANPGPVKFLTLKDQETGSVWNILGQAVEGPLKGKKLDQIPAHNAMWFAWLAFWGNTEVYGTEKVGNGTNFQNLSRVSEERIFSGGPPRDGIPALTDPRISSASAAEWSDLEVVLGVVVDGEARAYPHNIGWWHEIVNDKLNGEPICVTFCPLTGTGLVFDGNGEDGKRIGMGVSGLLFNTNLIMYDRRDAITQYPQMLFKPHNNESRPPLKLLPVVETIWGVWKQLHPNTTVVSANTGFARNYGVYPYGGYRSNTDVYFPLAQDVTQNVLWSLYHSKDTVLGILGERGTPRAYPFAGMGGDQVAINDELDNRPILVVWDRTGGLAIPYSRLVDGKALKFDVIKS